MTPEKSAKPSPFGNPPSISPAYKYLLLPFPAKSMKALKMRPDLKALETTTSRASFFLSPFRCSFSNAMYSANEGRPQIFHWFEIMSIWEGEKIWDELDSSMIESSSWSYSSRDILNKYKQKFFLSGFWGFGVLG